MQNETLDSRIKERVDIWLNGKYDDSTKNDIRTLLTNNHLDELSDAFYKDLEFGTGGLRGIMGTGTNRVNRYTIGAATQGLSNYLLRLYPEEKISVVVGYDNRNNSDSLSKVVTDVFSANGIHVYVFESLRPTPELSFAIRHLGAKSGVMLTASHNPKEYNGYKAYGNDGGQFVFPHDEAVMEEVVKITSIDDIRFEGNAALVTIIGSEIDEAYIDTITKVSINPEVIHKQHDLSIVYTPIHGTGGKIVPQALNRFGFTNVQLVQEQMVVDGNFPTVIYPNPEEAEAFSYALIKAKLVDADIVLATDPDADRVGVAVKDLKGEFVLLNGNQAVSLLVEYVLDNYSQRGLLTDNHYIVKTIVTSYLIDKIAKNKSVQCFNVLTGFKYIAEIMTRLEGEMIFLMGGEESYGYLVGDHARDKDAVISCAMFAEMAAYYKDKGTSLYEAMLEMYIKYGFFREKLISITKKGMDGAQEIKSMMDNYRQHTPTTLGGYKVTYLKDYKSGIATNMETGETERIELPSSNVLQFYTEDGSIISARPSGTEPKIKFYCSVNGVLQSKEDFEMVEKELDAKLTSFLRDLGVA